MNVIQIDIKTTKNKIRGLFNENTSRRYMTFFIQKIQQKSTLTSRHKFRCLDTLVIQCFRLFLEAFLYSNFYLCVRMNRCLLMTVLMNQTHENHTVKSWDYTADVLILLISYVDICLDLYPMSSHFVMTNTMNYEMDSSYTLSKFRNFGTPIWP